MLIRIAGTFRDIVFPYRCMACNSFFHPPAGRPGRTFSEALVNAPLHLVFDRVMSGVLCRRCRAAFIPVESPLCLKCGVMFRSREGDDRLCGECIKNPGYIRRSRSAGVYDSSLMTAVHKLKYKGKTQLAGPLGLVLFYVFSRHFRNEGIDLVTPVPLHTKRMKRRGFNQACILVRDWMKLSEKTEDLPPFQTDMRLLERIRHTVPQTGLGRKERQSNLKGAFRLNPDASVKGKRILVVDDVMTTGSTANECARVLLKEGALSVDLITIARGV